MLPLAGLRVIALEQAVAVPLATRHLADLGAEVIKIERPDGGDFARAYDTQVRGQSTNFVWLNRNKRSVCLDLKRPEGIDAVRELAATADIFVQNLGPGAAKRLGLGPETLRAANQRLIYASLSGYGESGPYEKRKAYDLLIQGETGAASVSGTPEEPAKIGISVVDISGAMYTFSAILVALYEREHTGEGKELRISLFDTIGEWMGVPLLLTKYGGTFHRQGLYHNLIAPYGPYRCGRGPDASGTVNLAIQNQREWERFCDAVLGMPQLAADPRFATNAARLAHREALHQAIEDRFGELGLEEVVRRLDSADLAFGEFREPGEFQHHPQLEARDRWLTVPSEGGDIEMLKTPFDGIEGWDTPAGAIPALGQHTEEVLAALEQRKAARRGAG